MAGRPREPLSREGVKRDLYRGGIPRDWLPIIMWPQYFYSQQKDFVYSDAWQVWFVAGNGCGKTHAVYWSVAAYVLGVHPKQLANPPLRICCIEPDYDKVLDVALEKLMSPQIVMPTGIELGPMLPPSMVEKGYSKDHRSIDLKNGSQVLFVTNEQGWQAMRGKQFDILAVDEECDERVFDENLRGLRNAKGGGKVIAGLTPPYEEGCGPTWTKEKVVEADDTDVGVVRACMHDNPAITKEFIRKFSKGKSKAQIDVQVYGRYPSWGDLVHPDFHDRIWDPGKVDGHLLKNDYAMPDNWAVDWVMAFDWHPSKACAAIWGWVDKSGNVVIFDELDPNVAKGKEIDDLADMFRAIEGYPYEKRRFRRWQDPSAKSSYNAVMRGFNAWDAFRYAGIVTSAAKNRDPQIGVSMVNEYFQGNGKDHPRIFIYERCKTLIRALGNHYWKRGEDGKGKPDPKWSDFPVCLKYIIQEIAPRKHTQRRLDKWPLQSFKPVDPKKKVYDISHIERYA